MISWAGSTSAAALSLYVACQGTGVMAVLAEEAGLWAELGCQGEAPASGPKPGSRDSTEPSYSVTQRLKSGCSKYGPFSSHPSLLL